MMTWVQKSRRMAGFLCYGFVLVGVDNIVAGGGGGGATGTRHLFRTALVRPRFHIYLCNL